MQVLSEYLRADTRQHMFSGPRHTRLRDKIVSYGITGYVGIAPWLPSNPRPYLSSVNWPSHVLRAVFFPGPGSQRAFSCCVSLASFYVGQFLSLSLFLDLRIFEESRQTIL